MVAKSEKPDPIWHDPDDGAPWTNDMFERAEVAEGAKIIRRATGTVAKRGRPKGENPKTQVSVRLAPQVIAALKEVNPRWRTALDQVLSNWVKMAGGPKAKSRTLRKTSLRQRSIRKTGT